MTSLSLVPEIANYRGISFETLVTNKNMKDLKYLFDSKNTILTPHIAGWTKESDIKIAKIISEKIIKQLQTN